MITTNGVQVVELPALTAETVAAKTAHYLTVLENVSRASTAFQATSRENNNLRATAGAQRTLKHARDAQEEMLRQVMAWLWASIADPVLTAIGCTDAPGAGEPWPRLWWCPTGLLSLLPLHAAGDQSVAAGQPLPTVMDRVVCSYTPTVRALAEAAARGQSTTFDGDQMLVVAMPETVGQHQLPDVVHEVEMLGRVFADGRTLLEVPDATKNEVVAQLPLHRWAHFSCHGRQDLSDPSMGGLELHDGTLTVTEIGTAGHSGEFAFLSACQTATGSTTLPDEAISLAAAMHYTGYRHVIGTLWSVYARAAALVADDIYTELTLGGTPTAERAANALHTAILRLRDSQPPSWWTPFIHIGP